MVPKASLPARAAARAPGTLSSSQAILLAEKYGSSSKPVLAQRLAQWRGAAILPDNRVVNRLAGGALPDHRGLALIGDADPGDVAGREPGFGECLAHGVDHRAPNLLRVMLDFAGRRIDLAQLALRDGKRRQRRVIHDRARRGR